MLAVLFAALLAAGQNAEPGDAAPPQAPPPPAEAQPQLLAAPRAEPAPDAGRAAAPVDTLYFVGGGRVRGTVLEETPRHDVTIRLLDGTVRRYTREELARVEYADGTVSRRRAAPPAPEPPPYAPEPPRAAPYPPYPPYPPPPRPVPYAPAPEPEYARRENPPFVPFWASVGLGATFFGGDAERAFSMADTLEPQVHLAADGGFRLTPAIGLGVYMDVGAGDPARAVRDECAAQGLDCTGVAGRFGFQLRHTWDPATAAAKWLSIGTGWEFASVTTNAAGHPDLFQYTGREYARLAGGIDFRSNAVVGVGLYGSVAWGEYRRLEDSTGTRTSLDGALHTTFQAGVRLTLFP
jgi:hypothetical protein